MAKIRFYKKKKQYKTLKGLRTNGHEMSTKRNIIWLRYQNSAVVRVLYIIWANSIQNKIDLVQAVSRERDKDK